MAPDRRRIGNATCCGPRLRTPASEPHHVVAGELLRSQPGGLRGEDRGNKAGDALWKPPQPWARPPTADLEKPSALPPLPQARREVQQKGNGDLSRGEK